jgi:hypothetical protein
MNSICIDCDRPIEVKETLFYKVNNKPAIKGTCPYCGRYIKFVAFAESNIVESALRDYYKNNKGE